MDAGNPIAALSFIAGPALLTNASSVLLLGTINRYARALDRTRALSALPLQENSQAQALVERQLKLSEHRVRAILLSLTSFYTAVGSFALATFMFLLGAALAKELGAFLSDLTTWVSLAAVLIGVGALILGAANLAIESVMSHRILSTEIELRALQRSEGRTT
jgi:hypothetical protein